MRGKNKSVGLINLHHHCFSLTFGEHLGSNLFFSKVRCVNGFVLNPHADILSCLNMKEITIVEHYQHHSSFVLNVIIKWPALLPLISEHHLS